MNCIGRLACRWLATSTTYALSVIDIRDYDYGSCLINQVHWAGGGRRKPPDNRII